MTEMPSRFSVIEDGQAAAFEHDDNMEGMLDFEEEIRLEVLRELKPIVRGFGGQLD